MIRAFRVCIRTEECTLSNFCELYNTIQLFVAKTMKYSQTNSTNVYTAERIIHFSQRNIF